ncbi:hypothetical protein LMG22931_07669 [Paraburkholderia nemoris]|nr:hypothetical protein LMG22931_07669 [Paraburkholderia nemoris]
MPRCSVTGFSYLEGLRDAFAVPPLADRRLTSGWGRRTTANADDEGASLSSHRKWFRPRFLWFMRMLVSEEITPELRLPYGLPFQGVEDIIQVAVLADVFGLW